jgi:hypothetical protein
MKTKSLRISEYNYTVAEFQKNFKDKCLDVENHDGVAVITIPNGRLKIMPKHRKPKPGYSLRHGGVNFGS